MPDLPPIREVVARYGLVPQRGLGQHFLYDPAITDRIAAGAGDLTQSVVYEVGPGPGGLTRSLLAAGAHKLVAAETDPRCLTALQELVKAFPGRLRLLPTDALTVDETRHVPPGTRIVANLPYNIGTPLLLKWLKQTGRWASMTLMFQKEVAQRIAAEPGGGDYGRLSVITQWLCEVRQLFDVLPGSFVPAPKVTSSVLHIVPRATPLAPARHEHLEKVVAAGFGQRRKMLRTSLKTLGVDSDGMIAAAGVSPTARAEELGVAEFCALARAYQPLVGR